MKRGHQHVNAQVKFSSCDQRFCLCHRTEIKESDERDGTRIRQARSSSWSSITVHYSDAKLMSPLGSNAQHRRTIYRLTKINSTILRFCRTNGAISGINLPQFVNSDSCETPHRNVFVQTCDKIRIIYVSLNDISLGRNCRC